MSDNCISKCYKTNENGINPVSLEYKKNKSSFCFNNVLDKNSIINCDINSSSYNDKLLLPKLNLNELKILKLVYNIDNWTTCYDYCNKYKNTISINTLSRILEYSWISFYTSYKVNIDIIIDIYYTYFEIQNKKLTKEDIAKKLYNIKNLDLDPKNIFLKLSETF
tara:strand:- start:766 stop:1260 length:495 start_codon:yes stop_codon:yes gene_type:complete